MVAFPQRLEPAPAEPATPYPYDVIIFRYTRQRAILDGVLVDLMQHPTPERPELDDLRSMVQRSGFRYPVAMTAAAFAETVAPIDAAPPPGEDLRSRLWHVLVCVRAAWRVTVTRDTPSDRVHFGLVIRGENGKPKVVPMWIHCGPGDAGEPVLTIMLKGED